ncbi:MAG: hypothetical protein Q4C78_03080 [Synergistaceae bacterium]|nr:hypothetical protein [Synergistaceae bacterium]
MKKILAMVILIVIVVFATDAFAVDNPLTMSNPFVDVPMGHWSYDALSFLASHGVISNYIITQYGHDNTATRYEMASFVARALSKTDPEHTPEEVLEVIKKLVTEYKPELDTLGVKYDASNDESEGVESTPKDLHVTGTFWLDAEVGGSDNDTTQPRFKYYTSKFTIEKHLGHNSSFQCRFNMENLEGKGDFFKVDRLLFTTVLPWNIEAKFGYQLSDWDSEYRLYDEKYAGWGDEDSFLTGLKFLGVCLYKDLGKFDIDFYVGRNTDSTEPVITDTLCDQAYMRYGLKVGYKSESFLLGLFGRYAKFDGNGNYCKRLDESNISNYGVYINYVILNGLEVKGTYGHQQFHGLEPMYKNVDYWQIAAEADQDLLKLFSFWVQYGRVGEGFLHNSYAFDEIGYQTVMYNFDGEEYLTRSDFSFFKVSIHRNFTKKLMAFLMYERFNNRGNKNIDDTLNFALGVRYQYTPSIAFQLQYDWRDYGQGQDNLVSGREDLVRFRTTFSF